MGAKGQFALILKPFNPDDAADIFPPSPRLYKN
jgi:hypothetical protein